MASFLLAQPPGERERTIVQYIILLRPTFINTLFPVHRPHLFLGTASKIMYLTLVKIFRNTL